MFLPEQMCLARRLRLIRSDMRFCPNRATHSVFGNGLVAIVGT